MKLIVLTFGVGSLAQTHTHAHMPDDDRLWENNHLFIKTPIADSLGSDVAQTGYQSDGFHGTSCDKLDSFSFVNGFFFIWCFFAIFSSLRLARIGSTCLRRPDATFMISWRHWKNIVR